MGPIYVDFDDVLSESTRAFIRILEREFGRRVDYDQVVFFDLKKSFGLTQSEFEYFFEVIHRPDELLSFKPVKGAITVLSAWSDRGYEIFVVTGRLTSAYEASLEWLSKHRVPYHDFILVDKYGRENVGDRTPVSMNAFSRMKFCLAIEDSAKMAQFLSIQMGVPVALLNRPWNRAADLNGHITRYDTWLEISRENGAF